MTQSKKVTIFQPMKYRRLYYFISLAVIIPGLYSLATSGLNLSTDFTGGSDIVWEINGDVSTDALRSKLSEAGLEVSDARAEGNVYTIKAQPLDKDTYAQVKTKAEEIVEIREVQFSTQGPALGQELIRKTVVGIALAAALILAYITYRFFSWKYGITAILAMLHDTLVMVGVFSLLGKYAGVEVDSLFVTAVLTILSFSVHDTIVVYDRIRELNKKHGSYLPYEEIVNRAVVETMGRSLNNSMTIVFMLLAMYLIGGVTTKWFIFALLIGTISGTYSSTFTAAPLLVTWDKISRRNKR